MGSQFCQQLNEDYHACRILKGSGRFHAKRVGVSVDESFVVDAISGVLPQTRSAHICMALGYESVKLAKLFRGRFMTHLMLC
jgi:hypothetical protein